MAKTTRELNYDELIYRVLFLSFLDQQLDLEVKVADFDSGLMCNIQPVTLVILQFIFFFSFGCPPSYLREKFLQPTKL